MSNHSNFEAADHFVFHHQCMCHRITVVILCICLSVTTKSIYLIYTSKVRCHRVLYGVVKILVVWFSLKTLCSKVLASFANDFLTSRQALNGQKKQQWLFFNANSVHI